MLITFFLLIPKKTIFSLLLKLNFTFSIYSIDILPNIASKNTSIAKNYLYKGLVLFIVASIILFTCSFYTSNIMVLLEKGTDTEIVSMAETFVRILSIGSPIYIAPIIFNDLLKNMEKPRKAMVSMFYCNRTAYSFYFNGLFF
nr:MATE family efflux transporter [endosymbiont 'TC1' of Trimyema compressum]